MKRALLLAALCVAGASQAQDVTLDHVAINASDQARSVAFYQGAFGLKEIPVPVPRPNGPRWLALSNDAALHIQATGEKTVAPPRVLHFALRVADLSRVTAWLNAHNVAWTDYAGAAGRVKADRTDKVKQIYVQDPDGYWIEVNERKR